MRSFNENKPMTIAVLLPLQTVAVYIHMYMCSGFHGDIDLLFKLCTLFTANICTNIEAIMIKLTRYNCCF